jgi:hypothetical protein
MRTIETTAVVSADHTMTLTVPADIPAGACKVVVVVEAPPDTPPAPSWAKWPAHQVALVDPNNTFRREDLYGDDGR